VLGNSPGWLDVSILRTLPMQGSSAPRVMLLLSCQLCSLLMAHPRLMPSYSAQLQRLLMHSSRQGGDAGEQGHAHTVSWRCKYDCHTLLCCSFIW
jgi:hypothetical protein